MNINFYTSFLTTLWTALPLSRSPALYKTILFLKNNKGLGLLELIIFCGIGLVIATGVYKVAELGIQTSKIVQTTIAERDLDNALRDILKGNNCHHNLSPTKLADKDDTALYFTKANNDKIPLIDIGDFKSVLDIKNFSFENKKEKETDPDDYRFIIYYTKKLLKEQSIIPGADCDFSDPGNHKKEGCYTKSCKIDYTVVPDPADSTTTLLTGCTPLECASYSGKAFAGQECGEDEYLHGFKDDGTAICIEVKKLTAKLDTNPCKYGEIFQGYDKTTGKPSCETSSEIDSTTGKCADDSSGNKKYLTASGECLKKDDIPCVHSHIECVGMTVGSGVFCKKIACRKKVYNRETGLFECRKILERSYFASALPHININFETASHCGFAP